MKDLVSNNFVAPIFQTGSLGLRYLNKHSVAHCLVEEPPTDTDKLAEFNKQDATNISIIADSHLEQPMMDLVPR